MAAWVAALGFSMSWNYENNILVYGEYWSNISNTEKHVLNRVQNLLPNHPAITYVAYPWSILIDTLGNSSSQAENLVRNLQFPTNSAITVCQDVNCLSIIDYFKLLGISDVFWSNATKGKSIVSDIKIHPFPLYSDRCANYSLNFDFICQSHALKKKYFFSFVGSDKFEGLNWIYELAGIGGAFIAKQCEDYCNVLQNSLFSLCPTFFGANNIHIWESLSVGAIPVIISDDLCLPGNRVLWENSCVFIPMEKEKILNLPDILKRLRDDENRIFAMQDGCRQLWRLYGNDTFISPIIDWAQKTIAIYESSR